LRRIRYFLRLLGFTREKLKKIAMYWLLIFGIYILQGIVMPNLKIFGTMPLIFPVAVMCVALLEGSVSGGVFGLFSGIACDFSFNQPAVQFTLLLTVLGLCAGYMFDTVLSTATPAFVICTALSVMLCAIVQAFPLIVDGSADVLSALLVGIAQTLYSSLFTLPLYYLIRGIADMGRDRGDIA